MILADPGSKSTSVFPFINFFIFFFISSLVNKTLNVVSFSYLELSGGLVKGNRYMDIMKISKVETI